LKEPTEKNAFYISYSILILLCLLPVLPFAFKDGRMWGFNHLLFLPSFIIIVYLALIIAALLIPITPVGRKLNRVFIDDSGRILFDSPRRYLYRSLIVLLAALLFIFFPTRTEKGIVIILSAIQGLLGKKNPSTALLAFRIVSVFSGVCTFWFFFLIAELFTAERLIKILVFFILSLSSIALLFFGYVEDYPLIWTALSGFIYFSLKYIQTRRGLLAALIFFSLGLFIHLEMAIFLPALIFLAFSCGAGRDFFNGHKRLIFSILGMIIIVTASIFIWKIRTDIAFENIFLSPFGTKSGWPGYGILTTPHLFDLLNLLFLLSPALVLLIYWAFVSPKNHSKEELIYYALLALGGLGFLSMIEPTLGLGRDWDLFSICGIGLTLFLLALINYRTIVTIERLLLPLIIYLFAVTVPFITIYLTESPALKRTEYLINLDPERALTSMILLANYYREMGDSSQLRSLDDRFRRLNTNEMKIIKANRDLDGGNLDDARELIKEIRPDRLSAWYHGLLASLKYYEGDYSQALAESDSAIALNNYNVAFYYNRANIFWSLKQFDSALVCLQHSYQLNNGNSRVLEALAGTFLYLNQPESTIVYGEKLRRHNSADAIGCYFLSKAYALAGKIPEARIQLNEFIRWGQNDRNFAARRRELEQLITLDSTFAK
jgi:tetratricopeptide (TPR) repeat protein